jgi:hypothetical protein
MDPVGIVGRVNAGTDDHAAGLFAIEALPATIDAVVSPVAAETGIDDALLGESSAKCNCTSLSTGRILCSRWRDRCAVSFFQLLQTCPQNLQGSS